MAISILVIGDKYRSIMTDIMLACRSEGGEAEVAHLSEGDVVLTDIPVYFSFEFIVVPFRKCALALSEYRKQHALPHTKLVLFSGTSEELGNTLVRSHLFDGFVQSKETGYNSASEALKLVSYLQGLVDCTADLLPIADDGKIRFCEYVDPYFSSNSTSQHLSFETSQWAREDLPAERKVQLCEQIMYDWAWKNRREKQIMDIRPYWGNPKAPMGAGTNVVCFVMRPFQEPFDTIHDDHIKPALGRICVECMASDDFYSTNDVMKDIWDSINRAYFVVADMTGRNPNVMYEVGIAHTIGKPVILITQNIKDVPFDLRAIRHIQYEYTPRGCKKLEDDIVKTAEAILREIKKTGWNEESPNIRMFRDANTPARFD